MITGFYPYGIAHFSVIVKKRLEAWILKQIMIWFKHLNELKIYLWELNVMGI